MSCLPYPTFFNSPTKTYDTLALPCVGRSRIHPKTCPGAMLIPSNTADTTSSDVTPCCIDDPAQYYDKILQKAVLQSQTSEDTKENKQLRKKYRKEAVAVASSYLNNFLRIDVSIVDVEIVLSLQDVMDSLGCLACCFLDAGCNAIVLECNNECVKEVLECADVCRLPKERMMIHFTCGDVFHEVFHAELRAAVCERFEFVSVHLKVGGNNMKKVADLIVKDEASKFVIQLSCDNYSDLSVTVGDFAKSVGENKGHVTLIDPTAEQLGLSYAACIKTDRPDGLFTTVVCTRNNEALGLVYSSKESVVAALKCARGVYYSRSRNNLWRKGDTSGNHQTLHRIDADCDGDALRFTVTQNGEDVKAFCHLGTMTCWGKPRGLRHLEETLQQRLVNAPAGSYTKRLFEDEELLRNKLVEEAQELSEADTKQHVAEELADVLYFAMVRAAKVGVSIDDAVRELDKRSRTVTRRQGDSKAFRIQAGNQILGESNGENK